MHWTSVSIRWRCHPHNFGDNALSRIVYVNGEFVAEKDAVISVFDRGFLFADSVYEVSSVLEGKLIDNDAHLKRLRRSLGELSITLPITDEEIFHIQRELIKRNELVEGLIYLQATRGAAERDFPFPSDATPGLVMFSQKKNIRNAPQAKEGIAVISVPDIRWKRRDIKTVGLLAQVLAKQQALDKGAADAWMIEDGFVTEGSSNNAFIVDADGKLITRHLGNEILSGITRASVLELVEKENIVFEERSFTLNEAINAKEAFITSASTFVWPVISIDGHKIADGRPGTLAPKLREFYISNTLARAV